MIQGEQSVSGERLYQELRNQTQNKHILNAVRAIPREAFLDASMLPYAGDDSALPIGHGQTTSAPMVIIRMIDMMLGKKKPPLKILEIGGGCGYQTALLAYMGHDVVSIERIRPLLSAARSRLQKMGYNTVKMIHGDGFLGSPEDAPYDGIVICAECADIPPRLLQQLSPDGRLVLPLRDGDNVCLTAVNAAGAVESVRDYVRFVNMRRGVE